MVEKKQEKGVVYSCQCLLRWIQMRSRFRLDEALRWKECGRRCWMRWFVSGVSRRFVSSVSLWNKFHFVFLRWKSRSLDHEVVTRWRVSHATGGFYTWTVMRNSLKAWFVWRRLDVWFGKAENSVPLCRAIVVFLVGPTESCCNELGLILLDLDLLII